LNGVQDPGANIGRLMLTGYLGNYDLSPANGPANIANTSFATFRYCPAAQEQAVVGAGLQSSYYMNPHWSLTQAGPLYQNGSAAPTATNSTAHTSFHVTWFRKITDYPKTMAMLTEIYFNPSLSYSGSSTITHPGPGKSSYWNILLPDGHVATVTDQLVVQEFNLGGTTEQINSGMSVLSTGSFDDALDILETEADGRNPSAGINSSMALQGYKAPNKNQPYYNRCTNYPSESITGTGGFSGSANWTY
jgi:hypothetical protein